MGIWDLETPMESATASLCTWGNKPASDMGRSWEPGSTYVSSEAGTSSFSQMVSCVSPKLLRRQRGPWARERAWEEHVARLELDVSISKKEYQMTIIYYWQMIPGV